MRQIWVSTTYHDVVELVPHPATFRHQGCRHERTQNRSKPVEAVEETQDLISVRQVASPSIPSCILDAIAEACNDKEPEQGMVGGVQSQHMLPHGKKVLRTQLHAGRIASESSC